MAVHRSSLLGSLQKDIASSSRPFTTAFSYMICNFTGSLRFSSLKGKCYIKGKIERKKSYFKPSILASIFGDPSVLWVSATV